MALLIYDNGNLVKNLSDAKFPSNKVTRTPDASALHNMNQRNTPTTTDESHITLFSPSNTLSQRKVSSSSRLYAETGRKSDSLQDRRRLNAVHIMNTPVITVKTFDTVQRAWDITEQERVSHLVVTNAQGEPFGVVTTGDMLKHGTQSTSLVSVLIHNKSLIAVSPETLVRDIALIFMERKVSCVPVIDSDHRVVGIVCRSDLLRLLVSGPNLQQRA